MCSAGNLWISVKWKSSNVAQLSLIYWYAPNHTKFIEVPAGWRGCASQRVYFLGDMLPWGSALGGVCPGVSVRGCLPRKGCLLGGKSTWGCLPGGVSQHALRQTPLWTERLTDACEKYYLAATSLRTVTEVIFCFIRGVLQSWSIRKYILTNTQMTNTFDTKVI